jgi:hypothetical protein
MINVILAEAKGPFFSIIFINYGKGVPHAGVVGFR